MIIHHACGHFSRIDGPIARDQLVTYRNLVCPACAVNAKVPILPKGQWVPHHLTVEPAIVQGPPSRQQKRARKRQEAWSKAREVRTMPRKERRVLAKQMTRGGAA